MEQIVALQWNKLEVLLGIQKTMIWNLSKLEQQF